MFDFSEAEEQRHVLCYMMCITLDKCHNSVTIGELHEFPVELLRALCKKRVSGTEMWNVLLLVESLQLIQQKHNADNIISVMVLTGEY